MPNARLATSLQILFSEINSKFPNRPKGSDGWLGDSAHQLRKSEHNPDSRGIVHAIDVTVATDTKEGQTIRDTVLRAAIGDSRVWYVIHDGYIYSRTSGFVKTRYNGSNPHTGHIHISINLNEASENSEKSWLKGGTLLQAGVPNPFPAIGRAFGFETDSQAKERMERNKPLYDKYGITPEDGAALSDPWLQQIGDAATDGVLGPVIDFAKDNGMRVVYFIGGLVLLILAGQALLKSQVAGVVKGVVKK